MSHERNKNVWKGQNDFSRAEDRCLINQCLLRGTETDETNQSRVKRDVNLLIVCPVYIKVRSKAVSCGKLSIAVATSISACWWSILINITGCFYKYYRFG